MSSHQQSNIQMAYLSGNSRNGLRHVSRGHHPLFYATQGVRYRKLQVILTTSVGKLGNVGETEKVASGFFRNHLKPKLLAVPNIDKFAHPIGELRKGIPMNKVNGGTFVTKLLDRRWTLTKPDSKINQILISRNRGEIGGVADGNVWFSNNTDPPLGEKVSIQQPSFYVVRDDLLHPLVNGNKARKLDGLFPLVEDFSATDLVTCGGCQSGHTAAVAVSCAERNLRAHLLLRGEQPEIPTGYNLVSMLYGNVTYVARSSYAKRTEMLAKHADLVAGDCGSVVWLNDILEASLSNQTSVELNVHLGDARRYKQSSKMVVVVNEGAGDAVGLLGVIRLVHYLSSNHLLGKEQAFKIVVDAGTGTTAIGLALGALCLGLPWEVHAVMLAGNIYGYRRQEEKLISQFQKCYGFPVDVGETLSKDNNRLVYWEKRSCQRKFGNILAGEVKVCQQIAQQTGILVDPIYTLAAWELATNLSERETKGVTKVVMLHTGGTLGMFGLAQRYTSHFATCSEEFTVQKQ